MVVSHRETNISTNIRAIIEQLNLNPVERRRLIDRNRENVRIRPVSSPANITIGVYGCNNDDNDNNISIKTIDTNVTSISHIFPEKKLDKIVVKQANINPDFSVFKNCIKDDYSTPKAGKIIIGIWGENRKIETKIERTTSCAGKIDVERVMDDGKKVFQVSRSRKHDLRQRIPEEPRDRIETTRTLPQDINERVNKVPKEELPELEIASLNHTAAHHRISVRPKNRRPPRRTATTSSMSCSTITTISEGSDVLDSLEPISSNESTPIDTKSITILRKSSSRLSRNSDIFEELEAKLPKKPSSVASLSPDSLDLGATRDADTEERDSKSVTRKSSNRISTSKPVYDELELKIPKKRSSNTRLSKSPDSLDNSFSKSIEGFDKLVEDERPSFGRLQSMMSKSTDGFDKLTDQTEVKPMPRRFTNTISKSSDSFDALPEREEPRPVTRRLLLHPVSKFPNVSKSSDSLEAIQTLESDDSIERRRSSFEIRPRRNFKTMSMSSENFELLEKSSELQKLSSASDVHLLRLKQQSKINNNIISKSTENFDTIANSSQLADSNRSSDFTKSNWKSYKRTVSSESSDNLELDDKVERRARKPPKRIPSSSIVDIFPRDSNHENEKRPILMRKPPRLQKSSESSELGSTDTIDSDKRNKSSDSTETLDSLEKDLEQDTRDEDMSCSFGEGHDKHDSWTSKSMDTKHDKETADGIENTTRPLSFTDNKSYWRQSSDSKENIDIHQLLTIVSRMTDNGNNNQRNTVPFPNKLTSPPSSPVVKQEDNNKLFNNLLTPKNDEELQNMLNGNISEVSTDTKSFKEKLIMFEKLGK